MERIVRGRSATLTHTFYTGGTVTDPAPDVTTVAIIRADGTPLIPLATVDNSEPGVAKLTLTPAETALLDTLTVVWTASFGGQPQQFVDTVEVAGDYLFTIPELRALSTCGGGLANITNYPEARLVAMRTRAEQALEDACGVAFVPRYGQEVFRGTLPPRVTVLRFVEHAGLLVEPLPEIPDLAFLAGRVIVGYEHGHLTCPERVRQAAILLAKQWLTPTAIDDRAITMSNDTGTYSLFQAGVRGHVFSIPEVQATVDMYSETVMVA